MIYKHIVFDVDGTLLDTKYAVLHAMQDTLKTVTGNSPRLEELTFALGITGEDALKQLGIPNIPDVLNLWNANTHKYGGTIRLFDGIRELIDTLKRNGCRLGIVTSRITAEFDHDFTPFGINDYFDAVICADLTTEHKPSPAPLFKYMELTNSNSSEILYVGDSTYDMQCAKNADVDFALACWGCNSRNLAADYYPEGPLDLLNCIEADAAGTVSGA